MTLRPPHRLGAVVFGASVLAAGCVSEVPEPDPVEPASAVHQVVATNCSSGAEAVATGVAVADDLLVTVAHIFDEAGDAQIMLDGGRKGVDVVVLDTRHDIAVLQLAETSDATEQASTARFDAWLGFETVDDGQTATIVTAATDPATAKPATVVRQLEVTLDGTGQRAGIELEAQVEPGDSGAPVVAAGGGVAGIVFASDRAAPRAWAVSAVEIEAALTRRGDPISLGC